MLRLLASSRKPDSRSAQHDKSGDVLECRKIGSSIHVKGLTENWSREMRFRGTVSQENSLMRHGAVSILGMLRLRARPAIGTRAPLSMTSQGRGRQEKYIGWLK